MPMLNSAAGVSLNQLYGHNIVSAVVRVGFDGVDK